MHVTHFVYYTVHGYLSLQEYACTTCIEYISYFGELMTISFNLHLESLFLSVSRCEWASYLCVWTYTNKTAGRESPEAHFC
jgi:hypothetical protein